MTKVNENYVKLLARLDQARLLAERQPDLRYEIAATFRILTEDLEDHVKEIQEPIQY